MLNVQAEICFAGKAPEICDDEFLIILLCIPSKAKNSKWKCQDYSHFPFPLQHISQMQNHKACQKAYSIGFTKTANQ